MFPLSFIPPPPSPKQKSKNKLIALFKCWCISQLVVRRPFGYIENVEELNSVSQETNPPSDREGDWNSGQVSLVPLQKKYQLDHALPTLDKTSEEER